MSDPKTIWRQRDKGAAPDIRVVVAGSFTCELVEPTLGAYLLGRGFKTPDITIGPFGQIRQICDDYKAVLGNGHDALILLWRLEDLFPGALEKTLGDESALTLLLDEVKALGLLVKKLREDFKGTLIVSAPPYPSFPGFDLRDIMPNRVYQAALAAWREATEEIDRLRILDLGRLILSRGHAASHDARKWYLYRQPYAETLWQDIGRQAGRIIAAERGSPKKCIVLDGDNTLWGGIVGEDGIGGIALGPEFPGSAFRDFQKQLALLKSRGTLLAVASKNNPEDVAEVFDKHDAMVLKRDDIAAFEVHWESKVDSLKRIAEKLNIGTDAIVFIDDSAKEIDEVRQRLPGVICLQTPKDPADIPSLLPGLDLFDKHEVTDEDRHRTAMIAAEGRREALRETMSEEEFKESIAIDVSVFAAETQHIARIAQLINKTNQFNLTTRRRTEDEIEALTHDENAKVLGMTVKDKYGDYGLTGAAILKKNADVCEIDTLLVSCRVLGRGAEEAFMASIVRTARNMGCKKLTGKYTPTAKNAVAKDFYKTQGFAESNSEWNMNV